VQLPPSVRRSIEQRADSIGFAAVKRAANAIDEASRDGKSVRLSGAEHTAAYLLTRMPATYAASCKVLDELRGVPVASVLDIGAGGGSAALAAHEKFPQAREITMVERDPLLAEAAREWLPAAHILTGDLRRMTTFPPHDLVIAAWSLGELPAPTVARLWEAARVALGVIEPGTLRGAASVRKIREELLAAGAHMAAPCPAAMPCPMVEPDWCYFAARVELSSMQRRIRGGDLSYQDERFSYVALVRDPVALPRARILRRPRHHPGLIELEVCTAQGRRSERATRKRDRDAFRAARHAEWGGVV
jgi:ribosomal protein RSM22 (predicted rRNA methylase)